MPGESNHQKGEDGVRRAKRWLEATTRVSESWTVYDDVASAKLVYTWPEGGEEYSFDLGGILYGDPYAGHDFVGECKKYSTPKDQGKHYDKFLAQSYVTVLHDRVPPHHFMWITWAPFRSTTWDKLATVEAVVAAVVKERKRVFGNVSAQEAKDLVNVVVAAEVANRAWLIVLSDKQESLVISDDDRALVVGERARKGR